MRKLLAIAILLLFVSPAGAFMFMGGTAPAPTGGGGGGGMSCTDADLACESFDTNPGYDLSWTETLSGAATANEDASHSGTLSCTDKGVHALQLSASAGEDARVYHDMGSGQATHYRQFYVNIVSSSLPSGQTQSFAYAATDTTPTVISWFSQLYNDGGTWKLKLYYWNGSILADIGAYPVISLGTWYRFGVLYTTSGNVQWFINGAQQGATQTAGSGRDPRYIFTGKTSWTAAGVVQVDNEKNDATAMPDACP